MKLEKFKEVNRKKIGIILFTITCILLISGVILYRTFAIFQVNETQNMIEGTVQDMGDVEFAFYIDGAISKTVPDKKEDYSLDTSASKCIDMTTGNQTSNVNWDNENWEVRLKNISTTKTKCYLYFKKIYKEEILHEAIPDLGNGRLVPIILDNNGIAKKADITNTWYSYQNRQWANAVILKDETADYKNGDIIPENNIESYFVWIPRYRYQIFNDTLYEKDSQQEPNRVQEIQIQFEDRNAVISNGTKNTEWLTHPAFTSFNSNGFWVGKFETGYDGVTSIEDVENHNEIKEDKVIIKPNVYCWRYIQVANSFYTSYNYKRELESHLMKNTEWGAVAYLSHSKYGYVGNITPNTGNYQTGYADINSPWNTVEGQKASTNQNITGVYNMSGGAWEIVAGVLMTENKEYITGQNSTNNSGFIGIFGEETTGEKQSLTENEGGLPWKEKRYYDFYEYNTADYNYSKRILGDATGEMGPYSTIQQSLAPVHQSSWYNSHSYFIFNRYPWFIRGNGDYSSTKSIFSFSDFPGKISEIASFRIILTP